MGVESESTTPTKCPDSALPTLWMNGKLYKVETIEEGEESSVNGTLVFDTKNIKRITFYIDYGLGKGSDVSADEIEEIKKRLETFIIDKKVDGTCSPGTNTVYVEIEYLDGTIVKNGIDEIEVDGASYYIKRAMPPDCFQEILMKFVY